VLGDRRRRALLVAEVDGKSEFVNFDIKVPLEDFTSERLVVFGEFSYRFATF
jgi:hypothetical protein